MIFQSIFFFVNDFISLLIIRECFRNVWDEYIQPNHNKIKTLAIICSDSRKIVILFSFNAGGKCFAACALVFSYILNEFIMRFFFKGRPTMCRISYKKLIQNHRYPAELKDFPILSRYLPLFLV